MSKFDGDLHLVATTHYVPTTADALLERCGLTDAPKAEQANAIGEWLKTHRPTPMMEFSIRQDGFGSLLDTGRSAEPTAAPRPPTRS